TLFFSSAGPTTVACSPKLSTHFSTSSKFFELNPSSVRYTMCMHSLIQLLSHRPLSVTKFPFADCHPAISGLSVVLAFLAFAPLVRCAQIPDQSTVPGLDGVDQRVATEYELDKIGSITLGVVSHGNLVWTKSYGFADMSTKRPADRQTVYR